MARIPTEELERLKQEVSVQRLVEARRVKLKRHGADLLGLCPFHPDKKESLVVSPKKNLWHCLGACQTGGSVIDFVMRSEGVSFRHAVELLREGAKLQGSSQAGQSLKRSRTNKLDALLKPDTQDTELLTQVIDFYHQTLKQSPEALAYLESRGLTNAKMLDRFKLGFANRTLGYRLPPKANREGAEMRDRLQKIGIYRSSGHEHFSGSLVIPIFDEAGRVVEVYGRKITERLRKGTPLHLYLPGPHQGVWNLEAVQMSEEIILCESLIDALTFWCAGFMNVTASYGVEGFTTDHLKAFEEHDIKRVLIAYDRDKAGDKAAKALSDKLTAKGIDGYRIQFPKGMDANEYACKVQPAAKSLELAIRKAVWLGSGKEPKQAPLPKTCVVTGPSSTVATKEKEDRPESSALDPSPAPLRVAVEEKPVEPVEATPAPPGPPPPVKAKTQGDEVIIRLGNRRWRIRGLLKNLSYEQLKVNVLVTRLEDVSVDPSGAGAFYVDTLDLYSARHRSVYVKQASEELQLIWNDLSTFFTSRLGTPLG